MRFVFKFNEKHNPSFLKGWIIFLVFLAALVLEGISLVAPILSNIGYIELIKIVNQQSDEATIAYHINKSIEFLSYSLKVKNTSQNLIFERLSNLRFGLTKDISNPTNIVNVVIADYLGDRNYEMGEIVTAIKYYQTAVDYGGDRYILYLKLGRAYLGNDQLDEAVYYIDRSSRFLQNPAINPIKAETYFLLAKKYEELQNWEFANNSLEVALEADPLYTDAIIELGNIQEKAYKNLDKAAFYFRSAIDIEPRNKWGYLRLINIYRQQHNYQSAIEWADIAIEKFPDDVLPNVYKGLVLIDQGKIEEAKGAYLLARGIDPTNPSPYFSLGKLYLDQGNFEDAVAQFSVSIKLNPKYAGYHYYYGLALLGLGRTAAAKKEFENTLFLDPTNKNASSMLNEINK